ncbi:MAG: glycosyltransferase [Chitinophagaceae bacterium]|nr:glycosyltransferase [Chitinophagaceae bacterium]
MNKAKNINNRKKVLIAPLDWGLGHATRCIPIITELMQHECEVIIAADGVICSLLRKEFKAIVFLPVIEYRIRYSKNKFFLPLNMIIQLPGILYIIYREYHWLKAIIKKHKIDAVISDNRFGMYNKKIYSIYITHQLLIKTGNRFSENLLQRLHFYFINKYTKCWVPDFEKNGLAGELSHSANIPKNVKYIGALSRFKTKKVDAEKKYDLLIMLSGPEPQRTILEKILLNDLTVYNGKTLVVRGLPGNDTIIQSENASVEIINHLSGEELNKAIQQSLMIISRSGYTTIMDLIKLNKKAILIPTPGQTEQKYLAKYLMKKKIFFSVEQKDFVLHKALDQSSRFAFIIPEYDMLQYRSAVQQFVQSL